MMKCRVQIRLPSTHGSLIPKRSTPVSDVNIDEFNRPCYRGAVSPTQKQIDDIFNHYKDMILQKVNDDPKWDVAGDYIDTQYRPQMIHYLNTQYEHKIQDIEPLFEKIREYVSPVIARYHVEQFSSNPNNADIRTSTSVFTIMKQYFDRLHAWPCLMKELKIQIDKTYPPEGPILPPDGLIRTPAAGTTRTLKITIRSLNESHQEHRRSSPEERERKVNSRVSSETHQGPVESSPSIIIKGYTDAGFKLTSEQILGIYDNCNVDLSPHQIFEIFIQEFVIAITDKEYPIVKPYVDMELRKYLTLRVKAHKLDSVLELFRQCAGQLQAKRLVDGLLSAHPDFSPTDILDAISEFIYDENAWQCIYESAKYLLTQKFGVFQPNRTEIISSDQTLFDVVITLQQNNIAAAFCEIDTLWESMDTAGDVMYIYDEINKLYSLRNRDELYEYLYKLLKRILETQIPKLKRQVMCCQGDDKKQIETLITMSTFALRKVNSVAWSMTLSRATAIMLHTRTKNRGFAAKLNASRHLFGLQGGKVIDANTIVTDSKGIRTILVRERTRDDFCTFEAPEPYDPEASGDEFLEFLMKCMCRNSQAVECILRLLAYCMTGYTAPRIAPLCLGDTTNGKGVFGHIIEKIWGVYQHTATKDVFIKAGSTSANAASPHIRQLMHKFMAMCQEIDKDDKWNVALFKRITGGDKLDARNLNENNNQFQQTHKLWIFCNELPSGKIDEAMFARIIMILFEAKFVTPEQEIEWNLRINDVNVYRAEDNYQDRFDDVKLRSGALNI